MRTSPDIIADRDHHIRRLDVFGADNQIVNRSNFLAVIIIYFAADDFGCAVARQKFLYIGRDRCGLRQILGMRRQRDRGGAKRRQIDKNKSRAFRGVFPS